MTDIFDEVELLTVTYKSEYIINHCLSNINENFKITIVENSNDIYFKEKLEQRKNTKCILTGKNLRFWICFQLRSKINQKKIHFPF